MSSIRPLRVFARHPRAGDTGRQGFLRLTAVAALCAAVLPPATAADVDIAVVSPTRLPATLTHRAVVDLSGTLRGDVASLSLRVSSGRGERAVSLGAADADGVRAWAVHGVPLHEGRNLLTLKALGVDGRRAVRTLDVLRVDAVPAEMPQRQSVTWHHQTVDAVVRHGRAFIEGDIDLGDARLLAVPRIGVDAGIVVADSSSLWPKVAGVAQIPYVISQGNDNVAPAIALYNNQLAGVIQFVPRGTQADYVDFALDPDDLSGTGESQVGRIGGRQVIGGSILVDEPTLTHEMGHATGLYHEQSRTDRDAFVSILSANIIKSLDDNFDVQTFNAQQFGLYDVQSVMHYYPFAFSKNGEPTLETIPAGMRMSDLGQMSAGDLDAVKRLYGMAPKAVTVTSNPPGLQVLVDGATVTTPASFNFALGSHHTLAVPAGAQVLDGETYVYGRWNDVAAASHGVTIAPGNGLVPSPAAKPAVTVYQASFVQMVPYAPYVDQPAFGSVAATPAAKTLPGVSGVYYPVRSAVTLTATPTAGHNFYRFYTATGPNGLNPQVTRNPDVVSAYFATQPDVTIGTAPTGRWLWIDGDFYYGPANWNTDHPEDGAWSPGTSHHLDVQVSPQLPYSYSIRYPWTTWSDGGAMAHDIVAPAAPAAITASFGTQYNVSTWTTPSCGGSVTVNPASTDTFYDAGASVVFDETPVAAWTFSGWQQDLAGTTHPQSLAMTDERLVVASYDTVVKPLTLAGFSPTFLPAGATGQSLAILGTGFTSSTAVFVNGVYVAPQKATATQLTIRLTTAQLKNAGAVEIGVDNFPAGSPCAVYVQKVFPVLAATAVPDVKPSVSQLIFPSQSVGSASAPQSVTLTNAGGAVAAIYDPAATGPNASDFVVADNCANNLAAAGQCTVSVTFKPKAKGARSATLLLLDSAFDSPQAVLLSGTATK